VTTEPGMGHGVQMARAADQAAFGESQRRITLLAARPALNKVMTGNGHSKTRTQCKVQ
jgi:hypothetical protein